ncbi:MAG: hypothetical protein MJ153_00330 [Clostridia bacterium]|nr:hypothetical protein [Clostridia bacterium]
MLFDLILRAEETVVPTVEATPTPYPDNLQYHYLTEYFTGDMELWSILNIVIAFGFAFLIMFAILFCRYKRSKKA